MDTFGDMDYFEGAYGAFRQELWDRLSEGVFSRMARLVGLQDVPAGDELFDLFAARLHQLCHIGSAYPDDPGVAL